MKRSPLKRKTTLRANRPMRKHQPRPRSPANQAHLDAVRRLSCCARLLTACHGIVAPHHDTAERGLGQKASDLRTMPICFGHHRAFHDARWPFRGWTRDQRREWQQERIEETLLLTAQS